MMYSANQFRDALKLRYPAVELISSTTSLVSMAAFNFSAISAGAIDSCLAKAKHGSERSPMFFSLDTEIIDFQWSLLMPNVAKAGDNKASTCCLSISIISHHRVSKYCS